MILLVALQFEVFAAGSNDRGKLGINVDQQYTPYKTKFTRLHIDDDLSAFSMGLEHVVAVTSDGRLYGWGSNHYNQLLTLSDDATQFISPYLIDWFSKNERRVRRAAAGNRHTIVLTTNGEVFTFGDNCFGQLGKNQTYVNATTTTPVKVDFPEAVVPVWVTAMEDTSFVKMYDGSVYIFGGCTNNICGPPYAQPFISEPYKMNISFLVKKIYMGYGAVFMIDTTGLTWAIGSNFYGQLCRANGSNLMEYTIIPNLYNIAYIGLGERHSVFLSSGAAIGCGNGDEYQLGAGVYGNHAEPVIIAPNADSISASARGTIVVRNGKPSSTGNCTRGELGLEVKLYRYLTQIPDIQGVRNAFSYRDYSFIMSYFVEEESGLSWWAITLIVVFSLLAVAGLAWLVTWIVKNKRSLFSLSKYKKIDEKSALAQNQAELEAW